MASHKYQRGQNAPFDYVFVLNILVVDRKRIATERTLWVVLFGNTHVGISYLPKPAAYGSSKLPSTAL